MKNKPYYISDDHVRSFGGKTEGFADRDEAMKEKKHLKAYLAGKTTYRHGFKTIDLGDEMVDVLPDWIARQPAHFKVEEKWTPITQK